MTTLRLQSGREKSHSIFRRLCTQGLDPCQRSAGALKREIWLSRWSRHRAASAVSVTRSRQGTRRAGGPQHPSAHLCSSEGYFGVFPPRPQLPVLGAGFPVLREKEAPPNPAIHKKTRSDADKSLFFPPRCTRPRWRTEEPGERRPHQAWGPSAEPLQGREPPWEEQPPPLVSG